MTAQRKFQGSSAFKKSCISFHEKHGRKAPCACSLLKFGIPGSNASENVELCRTVPITSPVVN
jgi:hypothetical protein